MATAQKPFQPTEIIGPYNCSAPGFTKQKLFFLSGNRWVKGPIFDPAAFKVRRVSEKTRSRSGIILPRERDPGLRGTFRVEKDRLVLFHPGEIHSGLQSYFEFVRDPLQFRIDPATGDLIEVRTLGVFRPLLTCSPDGFF